MKILKYFELLKENKELKELVKENRRIAILDNRTNYQLRKEIEKLNNNWNELRKWIVNNKHNENTEERYLVVDYGTLLGKMSELKGVELTENDKKQVKWLKEEFKIGVDKE